MSIFSDDTQPATLVLTRASSSTSVGELVSFRQTYKPSFKLTPILLQTVVTIAFGSGLMFGYNLNIANNCEKVLKTHVNESIFLQYGSYLSQSSLDRFWLVATSVLPVGAIIGCFLSNFIAHKLGRKQILLLNNAIGVLGSVFQIWSAASRYVELFILGRFITGIYCGFIATTAPVYLNEISHVAQKGYIGSTFQLSSVLGTALALFLGLPQVLGSKQYVVFLFVIPMVVAVLQSLMLHFCPESPRFLLLFKSDPFGAMTSLRAFRNCPDVSEDLAEIDNEVLQNSEDTMNQNRARRVLRFKQIICKPNLRKMLLICICLHASQNLTGMNVMVSYSESFLEKIVNKNFDSGLWNSIIYSSLIPFTVLSTLLVEHIGRRFLHISGLIGVTLGSILVTAALFDSHVEHHLVSKTLLISGLSIFMLFYALGPGTIPWLMVPELVPSSARSTVNSVATMANFALSLTLALLAAPFKQYIGNNVFFVFIVSTVAIGVFLYFVLPETKGKTSDDILIAAGERGFEVQCCCKSEWMGFSRNHLDRDNELSLHEADEQPLF